MKSILCLSSLRTSTCSSSSTIQVSLALRSVYSSESKRMSSSSSIFLAFSVVYFSNSITIDLMRDNYFSAFSLSLHSSSNWSLMNYISSSIFLYWSLNSLSKNSLAFSLSSSRTSRIFTINAFLNLSKYC